MTEKQHVIRTVAFILVVSAIAIGLQTFLGYALPPLVTGGVLEVVRILAGAAVFYTGINIFKDLEGNKWNSTQ